MDAIRSFPVTIREAERKVVNDLILDRSNQTTHNYIAVDMGGQDWETTDSVHPSPNGAGDMSEVGAPYINKATGGSYDDLRDTLAETQMDFDANDYTSGNWECKITKAELVAVGDPTHSTDKFEFDANDGFKTDIVTNQSGIRDLGLTTGGSVVTLNFAIHTPTTWSGTKYLCSNNDFSSDAAGFDIRFNASGVMSFVQSVGTSSFEIVNSLQTLSADTDYLISIQIDTVNGTLKSSINETSYTDHSANYSPVTSTTLPTDNLRLGVNAAESNFLGAGSELKQFSVINKLMSDADLVSLATVYSGRGA